MRAMPSVTFLLQLPRGLQLPHLPACYVQAQSKPDQATHLSCAAPLMKEPSQLALSQQPQRHRAGFSSDDIGNERWEEFVNSSQQFHYGLKPSALLSNQLAPSCLPAAFLK